MHAPGIRIDQSELLCPWSRVPPWCLPSRALPHAPTDVDDYHVFVKSFEMDQVRAIIESDFEAAGILLSSKKCRPEARRRAVILGILVDLDEGTFEIPSDKKITICKEIDALLEATARGAPVRARDLGAVIGRIMACMPALGRVARGRKRDP